MKKSQWKSLGSDKQFEYVSHRAEASRQLVKMVEVLEKENTQYKETIERLEKKNNALKNMIDNGLGWEDVMDDTLYP